MKHVLVIICLLFLIGCEKRNEKQGEVENKSVLDMKLNDRLRIKRWQVLKVPDGWIYQSSYGDLVFIKDERENK